MHIADDNLLHSARNKSSAFYGLAEASKSRPKYKPKSKSKSKKRLAYHEEIL